MAASSCLDSPKFEIWWSVRCSGQGASQCQIVIKSGRTVAEVSRFDGLLEWRPSLSQICWTHLYNNILLFISPETSREWVSTKLAQLWGMSTKSPLTVFGDRLRGVDFVVCRILALPIDKPIVADSTLMVLPRSMWLFVWLANRNCLSWQLNCGGEPPTYRCISRFRLCDGYDDCGNGWDESPTTCGQLTELSYLLISRLPRHACYVFYSAALNRKGPYRRRIIRIFVPSRPICESLAFAFQ